MNSQCISVIMLLIIIFLLIFLLMSHINKKTENFQTSIPDTSLGEVKEKNGFMLNPRVVA